MKKSNPPWAHYLEIYGADLSRWPAGVLKDYDVQDIQDTDLFAQAAEIDSALNILEWPTPSDACKKSILERIDSRPRSGFFSYAGAYREVKNKALVTCVLILALFSGYNSGAGLQTQSQQQLNNMATKIWYFGPAYALASTQNGGAHG